MCLGIIVEWWCVERMCGLDRLCWLHDVLVAIVSSAIVPVTEDVEVYFHLQYFVHVVVVIVVVMIMVMAVIVIMIMIVYLA